MACKKLVCISIVVFFLTDDETETVEPEAVDTRCDQCVCVSMVRYDAEKKPFMHLLDIPELEMKWMNIVNIVKFKRIIFDLFHSSPKTLLAVSF